MQEYLRQACGDMVDAEQLEYGYDSKWGQTMQPLSTGPNTYDWQKLWPLPLHRIVRNVQHGNHDWVSGPTVVAD